MSVKPGERIGPYEVREKIGAGGMGEVWKGYDPALKREAALKILPEEFARDRERLARFRREAQLLAQLNHPNIATIYGLHEEPGQHFVMVKTAEQQANRATQINIVQNWFEELKQKVPVKK